MPKRRIAPSPGLGTLDRVALCHCGCGETVNGRKMYYGPNCRKRIERLKTRLESKSEKPK